MEHWKKNPVIYEINTAVWLGELSRQQGYPVTFDRVPEEVWDSLAWIPVDAVWFMGVWERSPAGIRISGSNPGNLQDFRQALPDFTPSDNIGSPYCVRNYIVDSQFGGNEALAVARKELARRGIRLLLDFVPNHVAHDHPWLDEDLSLFINGTGDDLAKDPASWVRLNGAILACGKDPNYPAWQDVLQLNAFHPVLRARMSYTLRQVAGMCDGLRCDMAMLLLNRIFALTWGEKAGREPLLEFWEELIPGVKRNHPGFLFIAEAYWDTEYDLQQLGFDYCYDKRLYDRLRHLDPGSIRDHLVADTQYQTKLVRFIENHDEPRHLEAFPSPVNRAAAMIFSTLPGARLFHEGQMEGRKTRVPVFLARRLEETPDLELREFYLKLLKTLRQPLFHDGTWRSRPCTGWSGNTTSDNLLAWSWSDGPDHALIVVNYSGMESQGHVPVDNESLEGQEWNLRDPVHGDLFRRKGDEIAGPGLYVLLGPWKFHFLLFTPA
ncbi:MAG TPA: alpha-amylase family glycosyl hydrolase [Bacteroidales bacterium]|nr:alpha-amylase family glycosyl hydrolase [Bacteroidales bacterium]HPS61732.1 alpha-amylase family glycosyl hydrolase [Bacteroidales bacterium]